MCYRRSASSASAILSGQGMSDNILAISGDLACDGSSLLTVPIAQASDESPSGETLISCLAELKGEPVELAERLLTDDAASLVDEVFGIHTCFSPANFYAALDALTEGLDFDLATWPLGGFGTVTDGQERQRLLTRLLQQWTELHSFVATEGGSIAAMADNLRFRADLDIAEVDAVDSAPSYEELLDESERGWQLLLSFDNIISNFRDKDALLNPDYRPVAQQTNSPDHEQNIGLPVFVMEGLAAHMKLVNAYLRKTRIAAYGDCYGGALGTQANSALERSQRALHYANLVSEVWGSTVAAVKAEIPASPIPWEERWDLAEVEFQSARSQVVASIVKLQHCDGLVEGSVPLFFGDANGTSARYFAASDYILNGWAGPAVQSAISALTGARSAYISQRNSELQDQQSQSDAEFRQAELKASWGKGIIDFCGFEGMSPANAIYEVSTDDQAILFPWQTFSMSNCYIDLENPRCVTPPEEVVYSPIDFPAVPDAHVVLTQLESRFELCTAVHIRENLRDLMPSRDSGNLETFIDVSMTLQSSSQLGNVSLVNWSTVPLLSDSSGVTINGELLGIGFFQKLRAAMYLLAGASNSTLGSIITAAGHDCATDDFFGGTSLAQEEQAYPLPDSPRENNAECLRGTLGESVAQLIAAAASLATANEQFDAQKNNYKTVAGHCAQQFLNTQETTALLGAHLNHIGALQAEADSIALVANVMAGIAATAVNPASGTGALRNLAEGLWGADIQREIRAANDRWQVLASQRQGHAEYISCMVQPELILNGMKTWELQAIEATRRFDVATISLENQRVAAVNLVHQARAAIAREEGRLVTRYSHHYWLDEAIDSYERDFEHAQRLTFMALRAIEYEFQQSLDLRQDILGAKTPEELQNAIVLLRQEQFTRTLNSRRPEDSQLVMSLRDQILRIEDSSSDTTGERDWTASESFRDRVMSGENAVFDDLGNYLGQGIRFDLLPSGALEHRCGERLWSMTATLQGDLLDVDAPNTSLFVIRNNSFSSQWCEGHEEEDRAFQTASMQPVGGLFQPDNQGGSESFGLSKITAMLQPWFNVPRSEFYKESYSEGASEEFAGRGLYGEYTILFPWKGLLEDGFPLERVEDILIRFDYISVDNLTNL